MRSISVPVWVLLLVVAWLILRDVLLLKALHDLQYRPITIVDLPPRR